MAYRKAAETVENLEKDIRDFYNDKKLEELPGVGRNVAGTISEIIETGSSGYLEEIRF